MSPLSALGDLVPELILLAGALLCLALSLLRRRVSPGPPTAIGLVTLTAAALATLAYLRGMPDRGWVAYSGALVVDRFTAFVVPTLCAFALLGLLISGTRAERTAPHRAALVALVLLATLGGALLAAARDLVELYVAVELLSVSLVVLVGITKTERPAVEAAVKQAVMGLAASALLLYGLGLLYGLAGSTSLEDVARALPRTGAAPALALGLVVIGLGAKLGVVPLQRWLPDSVQGATSWAATLAITLGVTAGFAALIRVLVTAFPAWRGTWSALAAVVAAATMLLGSVLALAQTSVRRVLGYAVVAQSGTMLMGLVAAAPDQRGLAAVLFALFTTGVGVVGVLGVIGLVEAGGVTDDLAAYRGLGGRSATGAAVLSLGLLSVAGVPPLVGFFARLFLLQAAVVAGYAWLALVAAFSSLLLVVAVLRVVRAVALEDPAGEPEPVRGAPPLWWAAVGVCGLATIALGAAAEPLFALASNGAAPLR